MKVKASILKEALSFLKPYRATSTTMPILGCVRLKTGERGVYMTTSNLDKSATVLIDTKGVKGCPEFKWLSGLIDRADDDMNVTIESEEEPGGFMMKVRSKKFRASCFAYPSHDFPSRDAGMMHHLFSMGAMPRGQVALLRAFVSRLDAEPALWHAYFAGSHVYATDKKVLVRAAVGVNIEEPVMVDMQALASFSSQGMHVYREDGHVVLRDAEGPLWTREVSASMPHGNYVPIGRIFDNFFALDDMQKLDFDPAELRTAIQIAATSLEKTDFMAVSLEVGGDKINVSGHNIANRRQSRSYCDCAGLEPGVTLKVGLQVGYIEKALKAFSGVCRLHFSTKNNRQILLEGDGTDVMISTVT